MYLMTRSWLCYRYNIHGMLQVGWSDSTHLTLGSTICWWRRGRREGRGRKGREVEGEEVEGEGRKRGGGGEDG